MSSAAALEVVHTTVFAAGPGGGNPAPVVLGAEGLTDATMRRLAARFAAETVFVSAAGSPAPRLRYFVPHHEMEMCVHGTVGALAALAHRGLLAGSEIAFATALGPIHTWWSRDGAGVRATVEQLAPTFAADPPAAAEVATRLGVAREALDLATGPIQAVSTARPKLLVPLVSAAVLDGLQPALEPLWRACEAWGVTGVYPFTVRPHDRMVHADARQFPLRAGYDEDAATGVAACALGAYLTRYEVCGPASDGWHWLTIGQGRAMGRPSSMEAGTLVAAGTIAATRVRGVASITGEERLAPEPLPAIDAV